jgi:prevent-host-death family protein
MPVVGIRQLARNASAIIRDVSKTGMPTVVTDRGKPVGVIYPFDEEDLEDYLLANLPGLAERLERADRDLAEGKTISLDELISRLESEDAREAS